MTELKLDCNTSKTINYFIFGFWMTWIVLLIIGCSLVTEPTEISISGSIDNKLVEGMISSDFDNTTLNSTTEFDITVKGPVFYVDGLVQDIIGE